jgi:hypothetical protein
LCWPDLFFIGNLNDASSSPAMALSVRLGDDGEELARPRLGQLERIAHDALDADPSEDRHLGADFLGQAAMDATATASDAGSSTCASLRCR